MIMTSIIKIRDLAPCRRGYELLFTLYLPRYGYDGLFPMADLLDTHSWQDVYWLVRCDIRLTSYAKQVAEMPKGKEVEFLRNLLTVA